MRNPLGKFWNRITKSNGLSWGPLAWFFKGGIEVDETSAMRISAFYRGAMYLTSQLAKLPIHIKDKNRNILQNDMVSYLLNTRPNPEMNAYKFKTALYFSAIVKGNGYAEIERDGAGRPIALWLIDTDRVCPIRDNYGRLRFRVSGGVGVEGASYYDFAPNDLVHIPNLHCPDGVIGQGVVQWAKETLGIIAGADRMASGLFQNGGLPSGILKHPKEISNDAYQRMKDSWNKQVGGDKQGGVAILEDGVEFEALNMDPQVLQCLESRKFGVLEMARFFGVPPTKLYDTQAATYNNVENANLEVITDTIGSYIVNIESEYDCKLLNDSYGGKYSEIDINELSRGDMKTRGTYYKDQMSVGGMSPNQICEAEGRPSYVGGDDRYISTNNYTPTDMVRKLIQSQIDKNNKASEADGNADNTDDETDADMKRAITKRLNR